MNIIYETLQQTMPKIKFYIVALGSMLLPVFIILLIKVSTIEAVTGILALFTSCVIFGFFFLAFISMIHLCKKIGLLGSRSDYSDNNTSNSYNGIPLSDRVGNPQYSGLFENIYNPTTGFLGRREDSFPSVNNTSHSYMQNNIDYGRNNI